MRRRILAGSGVVAGLVAAGVLSLTVLPELPPLRPLRRMLVEVGRAAQGRPVHRPRRRAPIAVTREELEAGRAAIRRAVEDSRRRARFHIVVDKTAYTLQVYLDGLKIREFPVELGFDPMARKEREGDGRTPEGVYSVTWRRERGQTRFHLALLLDYPNRQDRVAGRTGGDIEIHGCGSGVRPGEGGVNWTLGCIALSNRDIEDLFALASRGRRVGRGTPVTIVRCGTLPDGRYEVAEEAGAGG